jgi:putative transposase
MKFRFIRDHRETFQVGRMCEVLSVSRSGFYAWLERPESPRKVEDRLLTQEIEAVHQKSRGTYGAPRIHAHLRKAQRRCSRKRVARLMAEASLKSKVRRKFRSTTDSNHAHPVAPNLLNQCFEVSEPNRVWVADITYIPTLEGWLYLACLLDLCSRVVVGWSMAATMTSELVKDALRMALGRRSPPRGLIHHSDRGSQYASHEYRGMLEEHGIRCSMSRKGNCYDNAVQESFFHTLKTELTHHFQYQTRAEARASVFDYIEVFYNRERLHSTIGYQAPVSFEERVAAVG